MEEGVCLSSECRWDMSKSETHYSQELARTITSIKKCALLSRSQPAAKRIGVKHPPLIDIPLNHVIVDELHIFLRITDILLRNVIQHVIEEDLKTTCKADLNNKAVEGQCISLYISSQQYSILFSNIFRIFNARMSKFQAGLSLKLMQHCCILRYIMQLLQLLHNVCFFFILFKAKTWIETFLSMCSVVQRYQR